MLCLSVEAESLVEGKKNCFGKRNVTHSVYCKFHLICLAASINCGKCWYPTSYDKKNYFSQELLVNLIFYYEAP